MLLLLTHAISSARLKNIEETEKAKRAAAEERDRQQGSKISPDEAHLVATRCKSQSSTT
jgi:hypothetical protein